MRERDGWWSSRQRYGRPQMESRLLQDYRSKMVALEEERAQLRREREEFLRQREEFLRQTTEVRTSACLLGLPAG